MLLSGLSTNILKQSSIKQDNFANPKEFPKKGILTASSTPKTSYMLCWCNYLEHILLSVAISNGTANRISI